MRQNQFSPKITLFQVFQLSYSRSINKKANFFHNQFFIVRGLSSKSIGHNFYHGQFFWTHNSQLNFDSLFSHYCLPLYKNICKSRSSLSWSITKQAHLWISEKTYHKECQKVVLRQCFCFLLWAFFPSFITPITFFLFFSYNAEEEKSLTTSPTNRKCQYILPPLIFSTFLYFIGQNIFNM